MSHQLQQFVAFFLKKIKSYQFICLCSLSVVFIGLNIWWHYSEVVPVQKEIDVVTTSKHVVKDADEAIRSYLKAAQLQIEIYAFTNNGSYGGVCEPSKTLYSLEGGILRYIKVVGATEVFCSTSDSQYLIEAKMPLSESFYCIDSSGASVEQKETREGEESCKD